MKRLIFSLVLLISVPLMGQVTLFKTHNLEYPVSRIVHFPKCGDSPIYLCKKNQETNVIVNETDKIQFELSSTEHLVFADHFNLYTTNYTKTEITIRKYKESGKTYKLLKELKLPKAVNGRQFYVDVEMTEDHLFYFAFQPNTTPKPVKSTVEFYNSDLDKVFSIEEDLSIYNIHCFGLDSVLFLKENIFENKLETKLYDHTGKLMHDEFFQLSFRPSMHTSVCDFLRNDGIIFTLLQPDSLKTHVMKFDHKGKMHWDDRLSQNYYGFLEFNDQLITYGGGTFAKPDYKLLFIDENKGGVSKEIQLKDHFLDFVNQKGLNKDQTSFIPFGLNVNPEHTWLCFVMSIYGKDGKSAEADRILIFHGQQKVQVLDLEVKGTDHPKVVPTDKNHLIVAIGNKVDIYKVK